MLDPTILPPSLILGRRSQRLDAACPHLESFSSAFIALDIAFAIAIISSIILTYCPFNPSLKRSNYCRDSQCTVLPQGYLPTYSYLCYCEAVPPSRPPPPIGRTRDTLPLHPPRPSPSPPSISTFAPPLTIHPPPTFG